MFWVKRKKMASNGACNSPVLFEPTRNLKVVRENESLIDDNDCNKDKSRKSNCRFHGYSFFSRLVGSSEIGNLIAPDLQLLMLAAVCFWCLWTNMLPGESSGVFETIYAATIVIFWSMTHVYLTCSNVRS